MTDYPEDYDPDEQVELDMVTEELLRERIAAVPPPSYVCPVCKFRSYHPVDVAERYCVRCHVFETDLKEIDPYGRACR